MTDDQITFYHAAPSRGSIVHWMLEEVGAPFAIELCDLSKGSRRQPGYLAINPMGKVPAIVHRGVVITEAAAICCYLAETFPAAGLAPPLGDPQRGTYLRWLFFEPASLEPAIVDRMLQRPPGPADGARLRRLRHDARRGGASGRARAVLCSASDSPPPTC